MKLNNFFILFRRLEWNSILHLYTRKKIGLYVCDQHEKKTTNLKYVRLL